ncbi:MAG: peptidylprolyl isomerase [Deltaproteobacteria bacterium]|nr:peptidylprolyl isomerase [Deltaproteobacteria bacterium]
MKCLVIALLLAACGPGAPGGPSMNSKVGSQPFEAPKSSVISADILAREPLANTAMVKHILISWQDLHEAFNGRQDKRAAARDMAGAETEVKSLLGQLKGGGDFDALMKAHSEDLGSATTGQPFKVTPDAQLVIEFRQLSLRLNPGEIGVCQSDFGFLIIKRFE